MLSANGVAHFDELDLWAEGGYINILDRTTGELKTETVKEMLFRARALSGISSRLRDDADRAWYRNEILEKVDDIIELCRRAKEQRAAILNKTGSSRIVVPGE